MPPSVYYSLYMHFIKTPVEKAIEQVSIQLRQHLEKNPRVLWLVSGGSCILPQTAILNSVMQANGALADRLKILLIDERYGPIGHTESNYTALMNANFNMHHIVWPNYLLHAASAEDATAQYAQFFAEYSQQAYVFSTLGIGDDGHIAGILPNSPATDPHANTIVSYMTPKYERITLSLDAIKRINSVAVFAYGPTKETILRKLHAEESRSSPNQLPSAVFFKMNQVYVFNEYIDTE